MLILTKQITNFKATVKSKRLFTMLEVFMEMPTCDKSKNGDYMFSP